MKRDVTDLLDAIADVLDAPGEPNLSLGIRALREQVQNALTDEEYQRAIRDVARLYGGTGSFSDLVLHEERRPAIEANQRLSDLRQRLYSAVQAELR